MENRPVTNPAVEKLDTLRGFLEVDPDNPELLFETGLTALDADRSDFALECFCALEQIEQFDGPKANFAGIAAMRSGDQVQAQKWFKAALDAEPESKELRFNLAWSHALAKEFDISADYLSEDILLALPQAALLDLQIAHELGNFTEAEEKMLAHLERHADYAPLQAAASVLAMDIDRPDIARMAAIKGGEHPDALTTLASLDLADNKIEEAQERFARALSTGRLNPRAEIGVGLVAMAKGAHSDAALALDKGAEQFEDHLGSWIGAGWAHLLAGDIASAKARFQRAMDLDSNFGEAHGSLAVIDLVEGDVDAAQRKAEVAGRLDPNGFSSVLAKIILANSKGQPENAQALLERALSSSVLPDGTTLAQAIARSASGGQGGAE